MMAFSHQAIECSFKVSFSILLQKKGGEKYYKIQALPKQDDWNSID
jgi:hypothetical protein